MYLHEFEAKHLLQHEGVKIKSGLSISKKSTAMDVLNRLNWREGVSYFAKVQVHAGARGKAGGVQEIKNMEQALAFVEKWLGNKIVTQQTGPEGMSVNHIYFEESSQVEELFYFSLLMDEGKIRYLASKFGGIHIEESFAKSKRESVTGLVYDSGMWKDGVDEENWPYFLSVKIAAAFGLIAYKNINLTQELHRVLVKLYKTFLKYDANMLEINPLALVHSEENTQELGYKLTVLDCKFSVDENALFRQPKICTMLNLADLNPLEAKAKERDLQYIKLQGSVGCLVNGAGLAMATMDTLAQKQGGAANFLDIGGGADAKKVTHALEIILMDEDVKVIFVNIFGGIMKCDTVASGIIEAKQALNFKVPLVIRLQGTNLEEARNLLREAKLSFFDSMEEAAEYAIKISRGEYNDI